MLFCCISYCAFVNGLACLFPVTGSKQLCLHLLICSHARIGDVLFKMVMIMIMGIKIMSIIMMMIRTIMMMMMICCDMIMRTQMAFLTPPSGCPVTSFDDDDDGDGGDEMCIN